MRDLIEWLEEPWDDRVLQFQPGPPAGRRPGQKRTQEERTGWTSNAAVTRTSLADEPVGSKVFTSSIGAGRRMSNLPFALLIRISCGPLVRKLGY